MKLMNITTTLSVAAAAMWMLCGSQSATQAQSVGVLGAQRLSPSVKLTIKANGWLADGIAQGTEYFSAASWNITASFKQLAFSQDADGTKHVDAQGLGTFYDLTSFTSTKANVVSHFVQHPDGTNETYVSILNARTNAILYTNDVSAQDVPLMLAGALMDIEMP